MTSDEHPSPEVLSASLDGHAPEWAGHLEGCARCGTELARLQAVIAAVGQPVTPPPPPVVDEAVARAMGAGGTAVRDHSPVPLRRRSRALVVGVASGSVAAMLLAVLAAFAVVGRDGNRTAVDTALAPSQESATQDRALAGAAPPGAAGGGDLGEVGEPAALAGRLSGRIPGTGGAPMARAAGSAEVGAAGPATAVPVPRPCEQQARSADPSLGPLVYAAEGSRQGRPVIVLGFGPGPGGVSLAVLARDGCGPVYATIVS